MRKTPLLIAATLTCVAALAACSSSSTEEASTAAASAPAASAAASAPAAPAASDAASAPAASSVPAVESNIDPDVLNAALSALCSGPAAKGGSEGVYDETARTCTTADGTAQSADDFVAALNDQGARVQLVGSAYTEIVGSSFPDCPTLAELEDTTATPPAISDTCMTQVLAEYTTYVLAE